MLKVSISLIKTKSLSFTEAVVLYVLSHTFGHNTKAYESYQPLNCTRGHDRNDN